MNTVAPEPLRLGLPKGRMQQAVLDLLADAGIQVRTNGRTYRPEISHPDLSAKLLKPQNIVEMLHAGSRDIGFAGADWQQEMAFDLVQLLDTGLNPVRVVAAAPSSLLVDGQLPDQKLVVASELTRLTSRWIEQRGLEARLVRSYGATEVFPPEDADCIVDIVASGATLRANDLEIIDELLRSSTRLYAAPRVMDDPERRDRVESFVLILQSVLDARLRVMLEVNVPGDRLEGVIAVLPCMREATVAPLNGNSGFAVRAAVPRTALPGLIPQIKACGGSDLIVTSVSQIVP